MPLDERRLIIGLYRRLRQQPLVPFPKSRQRLLAPYTQGVYVIRCPESRVVHVGRTTRGYYGLHQRLGNHLQGKSSFVYYHLAQDPARLRDGYTFQYLEVEEPRQRALLEAFASAWLCPDHLALSEPIEAEA